MLIGKRVEFKEYFLFFPLKIEGFVLDKCKTLFGDKYLINWKTEEGNMITSLIKPECIIKIKEK